MLFVGHDEERELVRRLRKGEPLAMREFYKRYGGFLSSVCSRYIGNDEDVKDIVQDCLIKIFGSIEKFEYRGKGSLKNWSVRITVNMSLDFIKKNDYRSIVSMDDDASFSVYGVSGVSDPEWDDPDVDGIPPDVVHAMIRELPLGYRTVLNLFVIENRSHKEISELLGIKETTSASQYHRARIILAGKLNEYRKKHR
ncbi:RNA polymerase sigma factor [Xylanibacter muris]|uniref:RNA polymerase sigma factor n=1 Tax=Xylanibacter muris TaxID=2736290 RepID=A0ABX2AM56_9BACT|nr:RNA polymerase sigma factor [Xylanibacter muris]NPD91948.1 RNA polymerase sigma factor [Xylanibacter muris]